MSGRLPSRIGAYDNGAEFTASTPDIRPLSAGERLLYLHLGEKCISWAPTSSTASKNGSRPKFTQQTCPGHRKPISRDYNKDEERAYTFGVSTIDTVRDAGPVARSMQDRLR